MTNDHGEFFILLLCHFSGFGAENVFLPSTMMVVAGNKSS